jgi:GxxExxY protein
MTLIDESTRIDKKVIHKELSFAIMEAAFEVHNTLGPGYSEGIYESALAKEFRDRDIKYERQKLIEVQYR